MTIELLTLPTDGPANLKAMATVIVALVVLATLSYYAWKFFTTKKV